MSSLRSPQLLLLLSVLVLPAQRSPAQSFYLDPPDRRRVLFLGNSITRAGDFVDIVDAYLFAQFPDRTYQLINLGLSSETVSGLTEADHPFPRPRLHERLDRALRRVEPDVIVACYGMNDGIYHPFRPDRFAAFRRGMNELIHEVQESGAEVVLLTPPPFDSVPIADRTRPAGAEDYSYRRPYHGYDQVLTRYARWIEAQRDRVAGVVDVHAVLEAHLSAKRRAAPGYALSTDGIHPDTLGHLLMARALLTAWEAPNATALPTSRPALRRWMHGRDSLMRLVRRRQDVLSDAWLQHVGHARPGTYDALPLEEATERAARLRRTIRTHVQRAPQTP